MFAPAIRTHARFSPPDTTRVTQKRVLTRDFQTYALKQGWNEMLLPIRRKLNDPKIETSLVIKRDQICDDRHRKDFVDFPGGGHERKTQQLF
jgi:hypothetical protein